MLHAGRQKIKSQGLPLSRSRWPRTGQQSTLCIPLTIYTLCLRPCLKCWPGYLCQLDLIQFYSGSSLLSLCSTDGHVWISFTSNDQLRQQQQQAARAGIPAGTASLRSLPTLPGPKFKIATILYEARVLLFSRMRGGYDTQQTALAYNLSDS